MKILFILESGAPFPITNGGHIRTWNFVHALYNRHELTLICIKRNQEEAGKDVLEKYFDAIHYVDIAPRQYANPGGIIRRLKLFFYMVRGIPWEISLSYKKEFNDALLKLLKREKFDIIFSRYFVAGKYLLLNGKPAGAKTILDIDDLDFVKNKRNIKVTAGGGVYAKIRHSLNNFLLRRYYGKIKFFERNLVCSDIDLNIMRREYGLKNVAIIPNSVNVERFSSLSTFSSTGRRERIILICGTLGYEPNIDGVKWFLKEIFPKITEKVEGVTVNIVGSSPPPEILGCADGKTIFVHGDVKDVCDYYETCYVAAVPLRVGGGTRIKILEALASSRPVVSTRIGAEGLGVTDRENIMLASDADEFAARCVELFNNAKLAQKIVTQGYDYVKNTYDNQNVQSRISDLFESLERI